MTSANLTAYSPGGDRVRRCDARVKVVVMVVFSCAVLAVRTWTGALALALALGACAHESRLRLGRVARQVVPILVVMGVLVVVNTVALTGGGPAPMRSVRLAPGVDLVLGGVLVAPGVALSAAGLANGAFLALRVGLLTTASLVLTTTTSSSQTSRALESLASPLRRAGVDTRDAASVLSVALRFVPEVVDGWTSVQTAQAARGAQAAQRLLARVRGWQSVLVPVVVGMLRRAETLAWAMDARCYGMGPRTRLHDDRLTPADVATTVLACAAIVTVACLL